MGLFDIFKTAKNIKRSTTKEAGATLYPDKIVIGTIDKIKDSYSVISSKVTILPAPVDAQTLGKTLRYHLNQSDDNLKGDTEGRYKDYLIAAGFKNRKEHYKNARHLFVRQKGDKIFLEPTINGGPTGKDRGFANTVDPPLIIDIQASDSELGDTIRRGWHKCV